MSKAWCSESMYFSRTVRGCWLAGTSFVFSKSGIIPNIRLGGTAKSESFGLPVFCPGGGLAVAALRTAGELAAAGDWLPAWPTLEALWARSGSEMAQDRRPAQRMLSRHRFIPQHPPAATKSFFIRAD